MTSDRASAEADPGAREAATRIVKTLQDAGHVALFAGGCVRDMLLNREPSDYDVATSARPDEVMAIFRRTQKIGAKFGVVLVRIGKHPIEVATFRRDLDYADGRHPASVVFTDAKEDAARRDFTINGMFFDPIKSETIDYHGGRQDLRDRLIRAIGEPPKRFAEDHLRLIRAVRFAARFGFTIEPQTWDAMRAHAVEIARISPERIREELEAILTHSSRALGFSLLDESGVLAHAWPGAAKIVPHAPDVRRHLAELPPESDFETALAVLFLPLEATDVEPSCDQLRCSNFTKRLVQWLHANRHALDSPESMTLADLKLLMANPAWPRLLQLVEAGLRARGQDLEPIKRIQSRAAAISPEEVSPPPLLTGNDLPALGLSPGPQYARILQHVYYAQLNGEIRSGTEALAMAREFASRLDAPKGMQ